MQNTAKKWTVEQLQAINADNENILVSAAAGSGKTSVMIERVIRLIKDGASLDRMLIVTFTRAAASDMKSRLAESLILSSDADPRFAEEYHKLNRSHISTLHTFCRDLLKEHFEEAGLDPLAKIGDPNLLSALKIRAFDEAMDELYARQDENSKAFISAFSEEEILDFLNALYYFILSQPNPFEWLDSTIKIGSTGKSLKENPLYALLKDEALIKLYGALQLADICESIVLNPNGPARYMENAKYDREIVLECIDKVEKTSFAPYKNLSFSRLSNRKAPDEEDVSLRELYKTYRNRLKKCVEEANALLPRDDDELNEYAEIIKKTLPFKKALVFLTKTAHEKFIFYKNKNAVLDFNDLEHMSLEALSHEDVQKSVAESFDYIFVDEYQDISRIQESIINKIHSGNKLFMVGDVRQSIYRFRLADPSLFLHKYSTFDEDEESFEHLVLLNTNFRSTKNILRSVNEVFSNAMRERVTELNYDSKARLNAKEDQLDGDPAELHIVIKNSKDGDDEELSAYKRPIELEAELISEEILSIVGKPLFNLNRNVMYKDIVILLRTASNKADFIKRALEDKGIPVFNDTDKQYYDSPEIADTINILKILDNPYQDVALLSALASPAFEFTFEELADIRIQSNEYSKPFYYCFFNSKENPKIASAIEKMERWRLLSKNLPFDVFIRRLLEETNIYACCGAVLGAEQRQANLRLLCENASRENRIFDLKSFLLSIKEARKAMKDSAVSLSSGDNAVRIMTVHKSKGLEFPIVFLANTCHRFRFDGGDPVKMHIDAGFTLPYVDISRSTIAKTYLDKAIKIKSERDIRSEEARLLYVAMTRAKNKLYIYATPGSIDSSMQNWSMPSGDYSVANAKSMADFLAPAVYPALEKRTDTMFTGESGAEWKICWHYQKDEQNLEKKNKHKKLPELKTPDENTAAKLLDIERSDFQLKTSVTALLKRRRWKMQNFDEETEQLKRKPFIEERPSFGVSSIASAGLSPQERGTAAHKFLSSVDLDKIKSSFEVQENEKADSNQQKQYAGKQKILSIKHILLEEKKRLVKLGILSKNEADSIDIDKISMFFETPLARRMLKSHKIQRELPFVVKLEQGTLLQGVIDCCFLDDDKKIVVVDYKTDRNISIMLDTYKEQMLYYVKALNALTKYEVKEAALYAIQENRFYDVDIAKDIEKNSYFNK